jgi:uncharacterized protein (TIGR03083 family)
VDTVTDPMPWVRAVRASHDRLAGIAGSLDSDGLRTRSYDKDWSIAQVLSHLGSQAEIFGLSLDAGLSGGDPPGQESFPPIWDKWNSRSPEEQAAQSFAVNAALVARVEALSEAELASIRVAMFGRTLDAAGLLRMRLAEHAVHTWDVAVVLDPSARVAPDAVELLIDGVPQSIGWMAKKSAEPAVIAVTTTGPARTFTLDTGGVTLTPGTPETQATASLEATAEALLRLVYGRADESAVTSGELRPAGVTLSELRAVFPGF